jgi:hypothetical protein
VASSQMKRVCTRPYANPLAQEATSDVEMGEAEAFAYRAALSLLARRVDRATVPRS